MSKGKIVGAIVIAITFLIGEAAGSGIAAGQSPAQQVIESIYLDAVTFCQK